MVAVVAATTQLQIVAGAEQGPRIETRLHPKCLILKVRVPVGPCPQPTPLHSDEVPPSSCQFQGLEVRPTHPAHTSSRRSRTLGEVALRQVRRTHSGRQLSQIVPSGGLVTSMTASTR